MKVIFAGYIKTGTQSIKEALQILGYSTCDYFDNFWYLEKEWTKILTEGGSVDDFRKMYEGVDAVTGVPCNHFWKELHEAFPEAKIIFTTRDEERWLNSVRRQFEDFEKDFSYIIMQISTYSGWKYFCLSNKFHNVTLGTWRTWPWSKFVISRTILLRLFRSHTQDVIQNAPKEKLLLFRLSDGWGPLCDFLGENIPDTPFPHMNKEGSYLHDARDRHPVMQRMAKEMKITLTLFIAFVVLVVFTLMFN
uniref:uncharacterized protein LOC101242256 n=1 Tax=Ciona intestinalis TaxID=7719 RepID=UPI000EF51399|nr:uncharacterized protein LOC101242256 [Ciona intestinalis]|eukprot:XP_018667268.2 uncharacterized protein LOC101242256 [Ciona intestinalis]